MSDHKLLNQINKQTNKGAFDRTAVSIKIMSGYISTKVTIYPLQENFQRLWCLMEGSKEFGLPSLMRLLPWLTQKSGWNGPVLALKITSYIHMDASLLGEHMKLKLEKLFLKESHLKLAYFFFLNTKSLNAACNESYRRNAVVNLNTQNNFIHDDIRT